MQSIIPFDGIVFIGLFHNPIPDSLPLYGTLQMSEGYFCFTAVKPGTYNLMATAISWEMSSTEILLSQTTLRTRHHLPIHVRNSHETIKKDIILFPPRIDDPPILISLPLLMLRFMERTRNSSK